MRGLGTDSAAALTSEGLCIVQLQAAKLNHVITSQTRQAPFTAVPCVRQLVTSSQVSDLIFHPV
jgi:hypothetical protein